MKIKLLLILLAISLNLLAQQVAKKPLKIEDFKDWNTIVNEKISNNGEYISFEINPQKGDGNLIVKNGEGTDTIPRGNKAAFGSENNFIVFHIKQPEDKIRKAKKDKVQKDKMPKDSLGIYVFANDSAVKFPKVKSFKIPEENAEWVAIIIEPEQEKKDTTQKEVTKKGKKPIKQPGDNLVLFDVQTSDTLVYKNVIDYSYAKKGSAVYFVQQTKDSLNTFSTLNIFDTETGTKKQLYTSEGWLKKTVANETGEKYAFIFS
ncbi:MAG: hypothetical protein HOG79_13105, partial [Prolixibacteraceae bacterium]|nr:hypothetical protein [Prolixibacteraceae bacterium]